MEPENNKKITKKAKTEKNTSDVYFYAIEECEVHTHRVTNLGNFPTFEEAKRFSLFYISVNTHYNFVLEKESEKYCTWIEPIFDIEIRLLKKPLIKKMEDHHLYKLHQKNLNKN